MDKVSLGPEKVRMVRNKTLAVLTVLVTPQAKGVRILLVMIMAAL